MTTIPGVTYATVTYGVARNILGDAGSFLRMKLSADRKLIHAATGTPLYPEPVDVTPDPHMAVTFQVPHVDQGGFIDEAGNAVTYWYYVLEGAVQLEGAAAAKALPTREFQVVTGQDAPVDLDLIPEGVSVPGVTAPLAAVLSVNGQTGAVALDAEDVGAVDVDDYLAALATKADLVSGKIPSSQVPAIALGTSVPLADQAAMLALTSSQVQPGDVAVRADGAGSFMLMDPDPSQLGHWQLLNAPTDVVTSVNGQVGTVVLGPDDVGAASPEDVAALQVGLNGKVDLPDSGVLAGLVPVSQGDGTIAYGVPENAFAAVVEYTGTDWPARPAVTGAVLWRAFAGSGSTIAVPAGLLSGDCVRVLAITATSSIAV